MAEMPWERRLRVLEQCEADEADRKRREEHDATMAAHGGPVWHWYHQQMQAIRAKSPSASLTEVAAALIEALPGDVRTQVVMDAPIFDEGFDEGRVVGARVAPDGKSMPDWQSVLVARQQAQRAATAATLCGVAGIYGGAIPGGVASQEMTAFINRTVGRRLDDTRLHGVALGQLSAQDTSGEVARWDPKGALGE